MKESPFLCCLFDIAAEFKHVTAMFGDNPQRPPTSGDGLQLEVQNIFPTLQGEGLYAGYSSVFIRLGGCNLACSFCDTEFESYHSMTLESMMSEVMRLADGREPLIVITGGEPMRQPLAPLCEALLAEGFTVQIETNGTLYQPLDARVDIVCSPKAGVQGYGQLRPDILQQLSALKFVISERDARYNHVPDIGQGDALPVYVQPMDEYDEVQNARNLTYTAALAQREHYRLSLQLHKIIGIA